MPTDVETRPEEQVWGRAALAPESWNPEARTVDVVFSTGADVVRMDWWTGTSFIERLEISKDAVDLSRINAGGPVLNTHSSYTLEDILGVVVDGSARIVGKEARATIRFSERDSVAPIVADVAAGIIRNISVGYRTERVEKIEATAASAEIRVAKRWTPYEVSLVPIPADAGAQIRSAPPEVVEAMRAAIAKLSANPPAAPAAPKESNMPPDIDPAADAAVRTAELDAVRTAERARVGEIMAAQRAAGLDADWGERHIGAGTTADAARKEALDEVAKRGSPRVPPAIAGARQDEGDTARRLLTNALQHRAGLRETVLEDGARQFRGFRLLDFARAALDLNGVKHRGLTPMETFRLAMHTRAGSHASGDFPDLLANTASKSLRDGYTAAPRTFVPWCNKMNLPDFKDFKAVSLSGMSSLAQIMEDGEVTYGTIGDDAETCTLLRYGKALAITYVAMINDDMRGFTRVPAMMAAAAARKESEVVYGILTANAAMADTVALFHATHSNTSTGALSVDATGVANLGAMEAKLALQTAPNGEILNLVGKFLLVPAALKTKAVSLFSRSIVPATAGAANPLPYEIIAEGRLDATSSAAHYLIADPSQFDTIDYGYLEGEEGPAISTDIEFDTDGMKTKVMHNFYAKAIDWRGMVYTTGA